MDEIWDARLRRAEDLEHSWPFAADVLRFYRIIVAFQREASHHISGWDVEDPTGHKLGSLTLLLPPLFDLVRSEGPAELIRRAEELRAGTTEEQLALLVAAREGRLEPSDSAGAFFATSVLHPYLSLRALEAKPELKTAGRPEGRCPWCGGKPIVAVLREDKQAETVRRTLVCSLCSTEWAFPRVLCPSCNEERPEKLPRFTAQEIPWIRVEACDSCRRYLKAVDLAKKPEAEPVVDELASTPLDVLARERGYEKIAANLAGL